MCYNIFIIRKTRRNKMFDTGEVIEAGFASSEKIVYRIDRKHKEFLEHYMYDLAIKTSQTEVKCGKIFQDF